MILDVNAHSSNEDIRAVYLTFCSSSHPDKGSDAETFGGVVEAKNLLLDPARKAQHRLAGLTCWINLLD